MAGMVVYCDISAICMFLQLYFCSLVRYDIRDGVVCGVCDVYGALYMVRYIMCSYSVGDMRRKYK